MELHVGSNTECNEKWTAVVWTADNIAVGTIAPCTCYQTVHSVKKLSWHICAITEWLYSVVNLLIIDNAKD